jgi:hypothetical protein
MTSTGNHTSYTHSAHEASIPNSNPLLLLSYLRFSRPLRAPRHRIPLLLPLLPTRRAPTETEHASHAIPTAKPPVPPCRSAILVGRVGGVPAVVRGLDERSFGSGLGCDVL